MALTVKCESSILKIEAPLASATLSTSGKTKGPERRSSNNSHGKSRMTA